MSDLLDRMLNFVIGVIAMLNEVPEPGADDPLVALMWLVMILLIAIAGVLAVIVWPIDGPPGARADDPADNMPLIPAGSLDRSEWQ